MQIMQEQLPAHVIRGIMPPRQTSIAMVAKGKTAEDNGKQNPDLESTL
jgi:hypothetical protein